MRGRNPCQEDEGFLQAKEAFQTEKGVAIQRLRGVIYARFSCFHQNEKSIEGQVKDCRKFAEENNIDIVNIYADRAISGKIDQRPSFQKMIYDAKQHLFDTVIVWKMDRFMRNVEGRTITENC